MIEVRGLTKRFGSATAVSELSFTVSPGKITGFLGPNGAGKTTTLRILLGLASATSGAATIRGKTYRELASPVGTVGSVLEATNYHPKRSGRNHLRVLAAAAGVPTARVEEVLEEVALAHHGARTVGAYSLGMRQRLSVAAALLGEPELLVLDEPANGLDPEGIRWLRQFLHSFAERGGTVFVSSHVLAEVAQLADEVVIIHRGRLVAQQSLAEITARASGGTRVRTPQPDELQAALRGAGVVVKSAEHDRLVVDAPTARVGEVAAASGVVLHELVGESASLEEAFLELTGGETT